MVRPLLPATLLAMLLATLLGSTWLPAAAQASPRDERLVLIDQDGSGPGGSNQMAMMALLQAPGVKVLGITVVSGDEWEPEEVLHTLRMLELIHRTDVPVVPGALHPLLHTRAAALLDRERYGALSWYGAWGDLAEGTAGTAFHPAEQVPSLPEGTPIATPLDEDAAHFLLREVHSHPHKVTLFAGGPLTDIALALSLDPHFAELTAGLVLMGGSLNPQTADPEFALHPRHEFNFWFDPEAAHIVLRAGWPRVDLTTTDLSIKTRFTPALLQRIASSHQPAAGYLARYTGKNFYYMWDELAACTWLEPRLLSASEDLFVDVDLSSGPNYGDTLTWDAAHKPAGVVAKPVHVGTDLDIDRFYTYFVHLMQAPPSVPASPPAP